MTALRIVIALLAFAEAGWMAFDGGRALVVGDYVTPASGPYAGELGPWAPLVAAVRIEPRSTLMKLIFVCYGVAWLAVIGAYLLRRRWADLAMLAAAIGSLWYLVIGTGFSAIQIVLLLISRRLSPRGRSRAAAS